MIDADVLESTPRALPIGYCATSGCAWAHPSTPSGSCDLWSLPLAMLLVLLYYYYSKKKARETEKKKYGKKRTQKKSTGKKVLEKNTGKKILREQVLEKSTGKKSGKPGCACAHPFGVTSGSHGTCTLIAVRKK